MVAVVGGVNWPSEVVECLDSGWSQSTVFVDLGVTAPFVYIEEAAVGAQKKTGQLTG